MKNKQIVFVVLGLLGLGLAGLGVWSVSNNDWNRGRGFGFFRDDNSYINNFYENTYGFSFVYPDTFELGMFCGIDDTEIVREISISSTDPLDAGINEIACLYVRNGKEKLGVGDPMYVGNSEATVYVYSLAGADYRKYEISLGNNRYLYFNTLDQYFTRSKVSLEGTDYYDHFLELADGIEMIISNLYLDDPLQSSAASNSLDWFQMYTSKFSVMLPPGFVFNELMGIDSYVGEFEGREFVLMFDYGMYSGDLIASNASDYQISYEMIDGYQAKIFTPHISGEGLVGIYFEDLAGEDKLNLYGENLTLSEQETALRIFRSIKFNR